MAPHGEWVKHELNGQETYTQENDGYKLVIQTIFEASGKSTTRISKIVDEVTNETEPGRLTDLAGGKLFIPNSHANFKENIFIPTKMPKFSVCDRCEVNPFFDLDSLRTLFTSPIQEYFDLFYDKDDTIIAHGQTVEPTLFNFQTTIDLWLEAYFYLQANLRMNDEMALPSALSEYVAREFKKALSKRKQLVLPLPETNKKLGERTCVNFAFQAQALYLAQRLLVRTDASTVITSPQHLCCFLPHSIFRKLTKGTKKQSDLEDNFLALYGSNALAFTLEDYILYERVTACSLFVEITASLNSIDKYSRDVCLKILCNPKNLNQLISCPKFFSRISVARQFVFEANRLISRRFEKTAKGRVTADEELATQKIFDLLLINLNTTCSQPSCTTAQLLESTMPKKATCRDQLYAKIASITAPINLAEYVKNPTHGPVAFVNPRHSGVSDLLKEISGFNCQPQAAPQAEKIKEDWRSFVQLCAVAEQIPINI